MLKQSEHFRCEPTKSRGSRNEMPRPVLGGQDGGGAREDGVLGIPERCLSFGHFGNQSAQLLGMACLEISHFPFRQSNIWRYALLYSQ